MHASLCVDFAAIQSRCHELSTPVTETFDAVFGLALQDLYALQAADVPNA